MADRSARVELGVTGQGRVRQALRGVVNDARTAERDVAKASKQAQDQKRREEQKTARDFERSQREQARSAERGIRERRRAEEKAARDREREIQRLSREEEKSARNSARIQQTSRRKNIRLAVGAGAGLVTGAMGRVRSFGGALGLSEPQDLAMKAMEFHRLSVRTAGMAGMDEGQRKEMETSVLSASKAHGVPAEELLAGLQEAQDRFAGSVPVFMQNMDNIAKSVLAANTPAADIIGTMGLMRRQFHLTEDQMKLLLPVIAQTANLGSISMHDISTQFGLPMGEMARNAGLEGIGGAREAVAMSQMLGELDIDPAEAATRGSRAVMAFNMPKVRKSLMADYGVNVTTGKGSNINGPLRDFAGIVADLAKAGFMDPERAMHRTKEIPEIRSRQGVEGLVSVYAKNPKLVEALRNASPEAGQKFIDETSAKMNEGPFGEMALAGPKQFADAMQNGAAGMQKYVALMTTAAEALGKLDAEFPLMTTAAGLAKDALYGLALAAGANALLGGGPVTKLVKGAGGLVAGGLGTAAEGAGLGLAASAGLVASAGAFGIAAGMAINKVIKDNMNADSTSEAWAKIFAGDPDSKEHGQTRGMGGGGQSSSRGGTTRLAPGTVVAIDPASIDALTRKGGMPGDHRRQPGGPTAR